MERVATREEIARFYSIDDIADGNDALDIREDALAELDDVRRQEAKQL